MSPTLRLRVIGGVLLVAGLVAWGTAPQRRLPLLPRVQRTSTIADSMFGGNSVVRIQPSDTGIRFVYELRTGDRYPWAGLNLRLADSNQVPVDASLWQALEIRARSTAGRPVRIQLLSDDAGDASTRDSVNLIYHALEFLPDGTPQRLEWSTFSIPSWWRTQHNRPDLQRLDLLDRLRSIEFQNGYFPDDSTLPVQVEILELDLVGPRRSLEILGMVSSLIGLLLLGLGTLRRKPDPSAQASAPAATGPSLEPAPLVVLDDPRARQRAQVVEALRQGFSDPELGLESFAASRGLSPRLVATLLKEATGLHFKGALNELRLAEAARLLRDSKANVSEIGYAVGFQTPSHFGRAFRERFGKSPSEYRSTPPAP